MQGKAHRVMHDTLRDRERAETGMADKREVVYVERKRHGLLHFLVFTWLFGIFYWAWLGVKLCWRLITWPFRMGARVGWDVVIRWPWELCVAAWKWGARGSRALTTRYGWRGWAVLGGAVVLLAILGSIFH